MSHLLFDSHLDIAWNALSYDRDQTQTIDAIRRRETAMPGKGRGRCTVSLPELRRSGAGVCLVTVLARAKPNVSPVKAQDRTDLDYVTQEVASAMAAGQLTYYKLMERRGEMRQIKDSKTLVEHWGRWQAWAQGGASPEAGAKLPVGFILSMEGSDPIVDPSHVQWWWDQGLRTASLAHYGQSAYAFGTGGDGPVTPRGREVLREFQRVGMVLDLTHTAHTAFFECLDLFTGPVFASHNNCRKFVAGDRQFTDEQVRAIVQRGGVIGGVLDNWMLHRKGWKYGVTPETEVSLNDLADHMEHICQIAGNARHVAIGSDLDGGFGTEQTPGDLNTHADLHKLENILAGRGFKPEDIDLVMHGNWFRFFRAALPERA